MANYRAREELFASRLLEWLTRLSGNPEAAISYASLPLVGDERGVGVGYFDPTEPRWFHVVRSFEEVDGAVSE